MKFLHLLGIVSFFTISHCSNYDGQSHLNVTICPDQHTECPQKSTCCTLSDESYGCCPFPKAVCCSDHLHCCPSGTVCDLTRGMCTRKNGKTQPWLENSIPIETTFKASLLKSSDDLENAEDNKVENNVKITCPGGTQTCADGYTCCMSPLGVYGCCPFRDAVCCSDQIHCCAKGSVCDIKAGRCSRKTISFNSLSDNIVCPGGEFQCPDRSSCCEMVGGQYGCCPLENASCCADKQHCCPNGFKCSEGGVCVRSQFFLPAFKYD